jgi:YHS domain-containing protein
MMRYLPTLIAATLLSGASILPAVGEESPADERQALAAARDFVGKWRGVGQVRRGSTEGAWIERQEWVWKFTDEGAAEPSAALTFESSGAKYFKSGALSAGEKAGEIVLTVTPPEGEPLRYVGQSDDEGKLALIASDPPAGAPARITLKLIAGGDRLVALYERKAPAGDAYIRLAEVGYTREGSAFGKGAGYVECIVTGGKGTIPVSFEGQTYYVCCSGCRDLFDQDPAAAVAEFKERKAAEKEAAKRKTSE